MKKVKLGSSDILISELTLGCMSLGTNKQDAINMIDYALEAGINHLDTADLYDFGLNEEIVGAAIAKKRERIILTSKVGNHFNKETKDWFWDPSPHHIEQGLKDSLTRLKTDYIDLYLLHGGTIDDPIDEVIETFEKLKKEGLIRAYGISSIRPNVIREYVKRSHIDAVMLQYNILDRRPEEEILNLLHEHQISVLARGPLAKGILSNGGSIRMNTKAKEGYLDYTQEELITLYKKITTLPPPSYSIHNLALQYVLHHPAVTSAVFGASSVEQIKETLKAYALGPISNDLYNTIQSLTKPIIYTQHR